MKNMKKWMKRLCFGLLAVAFVVLALRTILNEIWGRELEAEMNAVKAAGETLNLADLASRGVPDSENAALVYKDILKAAATAPEFPAQAVEAMEEGKDESIVKVEKFVADCRPILEMLEKVKSCRFVIDWSKDVASVQLPDCSAIHRLSEIPFAAGVLALRKSDSAAVVRSINILASLYQSVASIPALLPQMVGISILSRACRLVQPRRLKLSKDEWKQIADRLAMPGLAESLKRGYEFERAHGATLFTDYVLQGSDIDESLWNSWLLRPITKKDAAEYLRYMGCVIRLVAQPYYKSHNELEEFVKGWHRSRPWYAHYTSIMAIGYGGHLKGLADVQARLAIARAACVFSAEGKLSIEQDPFTGKPMITKRASTGLRLYSVGPNLQDDGGEGDDIGVILGD